VVKWQEAGILSQQPRLDSCPGKSIKKSKNHVLCLNNDRESQGVLKNVKKILRFFVNFSPKLSLQSDKNNFFLLIYIQKKLSNDLLRCFFIGPLIIIIFYWMFSVQMWSWSSSFHKYSIYFLNKNIELINN